MLLGIPRSSIGAYAFGLHASSRTAVLTQLTRCVYLISELQQLCSHSHQLTGVELWRSKCAHVPGHQTATVYSCSNRVNNGASSQTSSGRVRKLYVIYVSTYYEDCIVSRAQLAC